MVECCGLFGCRGLEAELLFGTAVPAGSARGILLVGEFTRHVNDSTGDAVRSKVVLNGNMPLAPLPSWGIRAEEQHSNRRGRDTDERNDEGHAPGGVRGQASILDQAVKYGGHEEVGYTATSVTKPAR